MSTQSFNGSFSRFVFTPRLVRVLSAVLLAGSAILTFDSASAATAEDLTLDARQALGRLNNADPVAPTLARQARAILVFPNIVKAGVVFGGSYGEGVLITSDQVMGYYNSVSASWGLQIGAQSYGYALFLMTDEAVAYLTNSRGWELGVGPTVVVMNDGIAANLSTSTIQSDVYAFIFDQQGLMAGVSIEGTKISPIDR